MENVIGMVGGIVGLIGGIFGIYAFIKNERNIRARYLHIFLQLQSQEGRITALTTIENRGELAKEINYAFLLIGPENEDPIDTAKNLAVGLEQGSMQLQYTNDFMNLKVEKPLYLTDHTAALIPLPFYYSEQVRIGDESLAYRCNIDTTKLQLSTLYSVRFFIFTDNRLHRSTHDLFAL